ncbi:MAG TPA: S8 family serine peptidase [Trebonia sp.]|nr:S8 family serine peptidase [Trebonia sp.]
MAQRRFLSVLAVSAAGAALAGGIPAIAGAVTAGSAGSTSVTRLSSAQIAKLSQNVDKPVIVILKSQAAQVPVSSSDAVTIRTAAVKSNQASLVGELQQVAAKRIKRFTLVNSLSATVSPLEAQRLAADPAVAAVIPDTTFTITDPTATQPAAPVPATTASPARTTSLPLHSIPGACVSSKSKAQTVPEGLALTGTKSAHSLGFTGAGVKVAYIADGLDPKNVNFIRKNGTSVFTAYKDFTGDGPTAPTTGGEAFLDANTIAGQGTTVYNVNGFSAQGYPGGCYIKIQGVAPGASVVGLDIFSGDQAHPYVTTTSMVAQAINYAVETAKVNVLNESFGGNALPDSAADAIKIFDDAAVKAGVVVSVSSGDAGTANTIGSPATDPNVISVGATTQFQAMAQANIGGARYFASKGWLNNNISSFSSAGFNEAGGTVNLVAPGDLSWASCDASAKYSECTNNNGKPSVIEEAGGTSESAPFVSGAAALVMQAYKKTHGGFPSPAVVKRILLSTATDLGAPAQEQGSGLLNSLKAVQLAESYGHSARTGSTVAVSAAQLTDNSLPGTVKHYFVTFTNEGKKAQTVSAAGRALGADTALGSGTVTLSDSASNQYAADTGSKVNYAVFKFHVPTGQGRLAVSIAYASNPNNTFLPVNLTLVDPNGKLAAESEPQGAGNYGNVDVRAPAAGLWTAIASGYPASVGGYNGKVVWNAVSEKFISFGNVQPRSFVLSPGQSRNVQFTLTTPARPGDMAGSLVVSSSLGGKTSIPVIVRTQVNVATGGKFTGTLTGGNGRGALGTGDYYAFHVPSGTKQVTVQLAMHNNPGIGNVIGAYLVAPDGNAVAYGQNYDLSGAEVGVTNPTLTVSALNPVSGLWTLVIAFSEPVAGTEVSDAYAGLVSFTNPAGTATPTTPLPTGQTLTAGTPVTIPVTITNTSNAPQDYFFDARNAATATMTLAPLDFGTSTAFAKGSSKTTLPLSANATPAFYFVPTHTSSVAVKQTSTIRAMTDLSTMTGGDPDTGLAGLSKGSLCAKSVSGAYTPSGGWVTSGAWMVGPTECGPFSSLVKANGTATDTLTVKAAAFDSSVTSQTGDFEQLATSAAAGSAAVNQAVELQPGQSATVNVTITPAGTSGTADSGTLYLDTLQSGVPPYGQIAGDEVAALPYSYTVG